MEPIINFLYHNDANWIRKQQYTEAFLYHLLEFCDQFFVNRLKNIIEIIMIEKISLRKCGEMFELACIFNCDLLQAATLDYIAQNMGRLLENRCLEHLEVDSLQKISQHYKQMYKFSANDRIALSSLYADSLTDAEVLDFVENFHIDLQQKTEDCTVKRTKEKARKTERCGVSERRVYEKEAINLVKNLSIEQEPITDQNKKSDEFSVVISEAEQVAKAIHAHAEKWTKVSDKKETKKRGILAGLKTNDILKNEPKDKDTFTPLKNHSLNSNESPLAIDSDLSSTGINSSGSTFNLSLGDFTPLKAAKMSQKQRKRQLSQSDNSNAIQNSEEKTSRSLQVESAWMPLLPSPSTSQLAQSDEQNVWQLQTLPKSNPINIKPCAESSPRDIETPNSFFTPPPTPSSTSDGHSLSKTPSLQRHSDSFTKILQDERRQKEYFNKMKSKSLLLTQIEETAIIELKKFYNVENVFDEYIEIERKSNVPLTMNFCSWKHD